jgi:hypothetical protein
MGSDKHGLNVGKPLRLLNKSIKFSFKEFFQHLLKGDVPDALAALRDMNNRVNLTRR